MAENSIIRYVAFRQNGQITAVGTVQAAALPALSAALALDGVSARL
ncbi:MAG: hypothetical protein LBU76_01970 [Azoarcus sp.]|jgi:hypothetical protein|nr:hypothetical protein [Azoarcus sp.]